MSSSCRITTPLIKDPLEKHDVALDDSRMESLTVVIPVFNGGATISEVLAQLRATLPTLSSLYEVILVDDGSSDNSWEVIQELVAENAWVRGVRLARNAGQHNALLCGIRAAKHDIIVTMDDDLQHPASEIPKLLEKIRAGVDVVYGVPEKEQHGLWRDLASQITKLVLQSTMGVETARNVSAFRAFYIWIRDAFSSYQSSFVSIDVLLAWGTSRFGAVRVRHNPPFKGISRYTFRKLVVHSLNMMTGFSSWPLQVASLVGFGCTLLGIGVLLLVVGRYLLHGAAVPGFAFLASIIAIFSGAQLFALGIIGEYLARMHFRAMERPPYLIRTILENTSKSSEACTGTQS